MWKLLALLVHILMIGFIAMIYFQSTVINGMNPLESHRELGLEPPADRLVVFLTDGLRAESFFRKKCSGIPHIRELFLELGLVGLSRSSAPTQMRPGHIAIFGGFKEDPAAALTNFQKNPSTFDTVFNRTLRTWGWGHSDVIEMILEQPSGNKSIDMEMFNEENVPYNHMDTYVFNKVRRFLSNYDNEVRIKQNIPSMFFVHLNDLDLVGHRAKPNTDEFLETLKNTENGIVEIYKLFERIFNDKRTVYLMTSDHGMTNSGGHGAGSLEEIQLPFFLWGAGVKRMAPNVEQSFVANNDNVQLPLHELKQTQLAPLMSALIGLPPPMNNMAVMPRGYMNVSSKYEAFSLHLNVLQLLEQVNRQLDIHQRGVINNWMPKFERLDYEQIQHYKYQFFRQVHMGCNDEAMQCSQNMSRLALDCLDYYRNYYRIPLVIACILTYMGWFYYLLAKQSRPSDASKQDWITIPMCFLLLLEIALAIVFYLHKVPCWTSFFLLVPLPMWMLAIRERGLHSNWVDAPLMQLIWIVITATLVIGTCFYRPIISLGYMIAVCANNYRAFTRPTLKFCLWLPMVAIVAAFSIMPPDVGYQNKYLLYLSMLLTVMRPLVLNENHRWRVWCSNTAVLVVGAYCVERSLNKEYICKTLYGIVWSYVAYALISIPYGNTKKPRHRVQLILFNLSTIYTLLCLSYESIFIQLLCTEYLLGVNVHEASKKSDNGEEDEKPAKPLDTIQLIHSNYRYAVLILCYIFVSILGTGNMPHVNSFDPNSTRVFLSVLNPMLIGSLIVLKLFIPIIIIMSSMYAFCDHARQNVRGIFICLLLICNAICLFFFFAVRNNGSWDNVRDSLSHLAIVHGLPILLIIFSWVPKQFLSAIPLTMLPMLRWNSVVMFSEPGQSVA